MRSRMIPVLFLIITLFSITINPVYAWQLGWKTYDSNYKRGINANVYTDWVFLQANIGILQGFTDNNGYWINIGVGNDTDGSGCSDPPVLWEEIIAPNGTRVAHYSLGCLEYSYTEQLSIIYDTTQNAWGFFYEQGRLTNYNTGGSTIDDTGSINMIEHDGYLAPKNPAYEETLFTNALQYTSSPYDGSFPSFTNPSNAPSTFRNGAPIYFNTYRSGSAPYSLSFNWGS